MDQMHTMDKLINHKLYQQDLNTISNLQLPWHELQDKTLLVTGYTGMIGRFLVDLLQYRNKHFSQNIKLILVGRSNYNHINDNNIQFIQHSLQENFENTIETDLIIHSASPADPQRFSKAPSEALLFNIDSTRNLLTLCNKQSKNCRMMFISSGEMYGTVNSSQNYITELDAGTLNYNDPRSCYPAGKCAAELLCKCYKQEHNTDIVIARPCHLFGPTAKESDSRCVSHFIRLAAHKQNLILKSDGLQVRSMCYIADAIAGILFVLLKGHTGNAYNIANMESTTSIIDLAKLIADIANVKLIHENPTNKEQQGYSRIQRAVFCSKKLQDLGWQPLYSLRDGLEKTIKIVSEITKKATNNI